MYAAFILRFSIQGGRLYCRTFGCAHVFIPTIEMAVEHIEYKELLETNSICYVEGYVENFHPMPYEGPDTNDICGTSLEFNRVTNNY